MEVESIAVRLPGSETPLAWALVEGGPLATDEGETLVSAMRRTAREQPRKGVRFINRNGEEVFYNYPALQDRAARTLSGLNAHGLGQGSKVILQLDTLPAHYTAFWGCLLGGIVPVTIAIAPTYKERNGVVNKLYNTWSLLGGPSIITTERLREALEGLASYLPIEPLKILTLEEMLRSSPATNIHEAAPTDVAFIQLSSGSTGLPKCIQETHRGVISHIRSSSTFNGYTCDDVTLNWLPVDHVVPLLTFHLKDVYLGCDQIHAPAETVLAEPLRWLDWLEKYRVTHTWSPNFGFKLVSERLRSAPGRSRDLSTVKFFMNAGEQVTVPVVRDFLRGMEPYGVREGAMQPAFGMAETATCMTYANHFSLSTSVRRVLKSSLSGVLQPARESGADAVEFVSLGTVAPGVSIRIAGPDESLLPENVIGRLQIKGPVVTPGYFNNDEANHEAFVGAGWFNSGDLGFISNGELFLTGREKETIIIRGAKFYCYEIEDVVNGMIGVEPTFVASCGIGDPATGTEKLAIFFSSQGITDEIQLAQAIRSRVTAQLGVAPGAVIPLPKDQFPKTTSGKIQRTQLKHSFEAGGFHEIQRQVESNPTTSGRAAPQNEIEQKLEEIWREVLGVAPSGSGATLFDLGGDSLKAAQILSRVQERWHIEFPLSLLFEGAETVEAMARWIAQHQGRGNGHAPPFIQPASRNRELPLSYSQLRIWLAEQIDPGTSLYNICRALNLQGPLDFGALERALNEIVQRHEILRTVYPLEGRPVQEVLPELPLTLPRHELVYFSVPDRQRIASNLVTLEVSRPFDLATGPMFRAKLIRLDENEHLLILTFHQIVTDAWSLGIFFRELAVLYEAERTGESAKLPPLAVQYADFAVWQQRWFSDAGLEAPLKYWKQKLAGPLPALSLPPVLAGQECPDRNGSVREQNDLVAVESPDGVVETLVLSNPLLGTLRAFNARDGITLYMALLATFKLLLHQATRQTDLLVGSPEAGRRRLETEKLLGCFVNLLVLRTQCSSEMTIREFFRQVRRTALDGVAHADVPFEKLFQALPSSGPAGHHRFFQVWFGPIDSLQPFEIGALRAVPQAIFPPAAQFDLSLFVAEQPEEVRCYFEYKPRRVDSREVSRMIRRYHALLSRVISSPDATIAEVVEGNL
jgi:acyl-CoA synthetase (AMP-forming)/AMP-acid ligase II/acyl carrier protein